MRALSVRQPWAWAILHAGKNVENRAWRAAWAPSGELLLHAAKGCTVEEFREAADVIEGISGRRPPPLDQLARGGIVGAFRVSRAVRQEHPASRWAVPGLVHLHLVDVRPLPFFVELPGQLGFFDVPPAVVARLGLGEGLAAKAGHPQGEVGAGLFPPPAEQVGLFGGKV